MQEALGEASVKEIPGSEEESVGIECAGGYFEFFPLEKKCPSFSGGTKLRQGLHRFQFSQSNMLAKGWSQNLGF